MIKNNRKIFFNLIIIILLFVCIIAIIIKYNSEKQKTIIPLTIINKNGEIYEYPTVDYIIKYNNVFVPLDTTLKTIFGDLYTNEEYQKINYKDMILNIDLQNNLIKIPDKKTINGYDVDNSVEIKIEEENETKYIPLYLISNLPNVIVKVDNKEVYNDKKYFSSVEALNKDIEKHKIVIVTDYEKKEKTEENYIGENKGTLWREEALKNIEKYRKKDINIKLKNQNNISIKNTNISLNMDNNIFNFGTAINQMNVSGLNRNSFNLILSENSYKWGVTEKEGYNTANKLYEYSIKNNYRLKAHNLWWDYIYSNKLKELIKTEDENDITFEYIYNKYNSKEINLEEAKELVSNLKDKFENIVYEHIKEEVNRYPDIIEWDVVNEIINFQYFKYYLYDENLLNDNAFLTNTTKYNVKYIENEDYYNFIINCYNEVRKLNPNAKLVLNDEKIKGYFNSRQAEEIKMILKKLNNNIDAFGVQCHINNNYNVGPQSIANQIKQIVEETKINDIIISEYDNYQSSKLTTYTTKEKQTKANYLRDMLIMAYSNPNISEFTMWVYYSDHFCDEERKAYEETVYPWLNYSEEGTTTENGYTTRLYKGTYTATVTLPNGKTKNIEFTVSDTSSDTVEVIIDSKITDVKIKNKPSKTNYDRNDNIDLTDGIITISYDDGTTKELEMNDSSINKSGFDSSTLGQQTIKLNYEGYEVSFNINVEESKDTLVKNSIINIENSHNTIKTKYNYISNNDTLLNKYNNTISVLNKLKDNIEKIDISKINDTYKSEYDLALEIINEYYKKTIDITEEELKNVINDIINLTSNYMELYKYYFDNDTINSDEVANNLDQITDKYNDNKDINLSLESYYINQMKEIYNNDITGRDSYKNYLNKRRILNTIDIVSYTLNNKVKETAEKESKAIVVTYSINSNTPTNKDVTAQIKLPSDKCSIENNQSNTKYTFTENGTKNITINIRGYKYNFSIEVKNIDKTSPVITGIEEGKTYLTTNKVKPQIADDNLKEVKLLLNGQVVNNYVANSVIQEEGIYQLIATDKAGNETVVRFQIREPKDEDYKIEDKQIKNIDGSTKKTDFQKKLLLNEEYSILRNNKEIADDEKIATGDVLKTKSGKEYILIVTGDINKDGVVNIKDIINLRKYILLGNNLDNTELIAADTNLDGKEINIKDLVKMRIIVLNNEE